MTKFNKRVLAVAIAGAIMLPAAASAADLSYGGSQQITFAKDLIVNNGTTIYTPNTLRLSAEATDDANISTVAVGESVTVKVTLTNGAKFDTTADAPTLVAGFLAGTEVGGAPTALVVVGTPYYSATGQELNFTFTSPGAGNDLPNPAFVLEMNSFQITNLVEGLFTGSSVSAEITVQNSDGQQILASRAEIATSEWGIASESYLDDGETAERIDVAACDGGSANRTRFSPNGAVGDSCNYPASTDETLFNVGGLILDITQATETDGATNSYINNFSAVAVNPQFNVVNTATWTFTVTGDNLAAFTGGDLFLSSAADCSVVNAAGGTIAAGADSVSINVAATNSLVSNLSNFTPGPETIHVCLRADDSSTMVPQDLSIAWEIDYDLPTQRVNPPGDGFDLLPLLLNGTTITFQNVNPGTNPTAQSFLRLTNHNDFACPIVIDAKDDDGTYTEDSDNVVSYTLPAQASKQFNSSVLESGSDEVTGSFGDGTGKWYVRVTAECANVVGSALNRNSIDGTVTNLTPERNNDQNLFGR